MPQVPYDINSPDALVKYCLSKKIWHVKNTPGIGPHSCCAAIEYRPRGVHGTERYMFGNSQMQHQIAGNNVMKCHGEASAVMQALEAADLEIRNAGGDLAGIIQRVYVELSPCQARCAALLGAINGTMQILWSFNHPAQVGAWQHAASDLCA